jgi:hypothetical protein
MHLWQFYEVYHGKDEQKREILEKKFDRQTIWRCLKDLSEAGIGLPVGNVSREFKLEIPSDYVVNFEDSFDLQNGCGNTRFA